MKIKMVNGEYSEKEKMAIGNKLAEIFSIHRGKRGYFTSWGIKTGVGIYEMIFRFGVAIHDGNIQHIHDFNNLPEPRMF